MSTARKRTETLAIHGGKPVKTTPFGKGRKHSLKEWQALRPIFERGSISMTRGPEVMALREKFKSMFGRKYAVTASSGTAALHVAIGALGIGRGDEVITSPVTDMGTLIAIMAQNAVPVFADIDPLTLMITPETVAAKITRRTRAIIVVHLAGIPADVRGICRIARKRGIAVVEDMAQSYLIRQGKRLAGTMGDMGCWSLNESKHIGAGDGGVLLTNKRALARRADLFADKCYDREGGRVDPFFAPYNYRLNNLVAAVCLEQMKIVRRLCRTRNRHGTRLDRALAKIDGITPRPVRRGDYATYWYYVFSVDPEALGVGAAEFAAALHAEGVGGGRMAHTVLDWTLFRDHVDNPHACADSCPLYRGKRIDYAIENFPGVLAMQERSVKLGMSQFWTARDISDIIRGVRKVARFFLAREQGEG